MPTRHKKREVSPENLIWVRDEGDLKGEMIEETKVENGQDL